MFRSFLALSSSQFATSSLVRSAFSTTRPSRTTTSIGKRFVQILFGAAVSGGIGYHLLSKFSSNDDEMYSDEELSQRGVFVEDQKLLQTQKSFLNAKLSLQVGGAWEIPSDRSFNSSSKLKERFYFLYLGGHENATAINKLLAIIANTQKLAQTKYFRSPEFEVYANDIISPVILSIDTKQATRANELPNITFLNSSPSAAKAFKNLPTAADKLYIVDGASGQAASVDIDFIASETVVPIFILNFLNEASIFRKLI